MGGVAAGALLPAVMVSDDNLLEPRGPRAVVLMAAQTSVVANLDELHVGVVGVLPPDTVAGLATQGAVLGPGQLLLDVFVTLQARFASGEHRRRGSVLGQRFGPVEAVLAERRGREQGAGKDVAHQDRQR